MQQHQEQPMKKDVNTILLSIITATVLGMFTFLWSMNAKMAILEDRDRERSESMGKMQMDMNNMRLDVQDLRIKVAQLQTQINIDRVEKTLSK